MKQITNKDLIQSYIMTTARYDFSVDEKRILIRLVETWQDLLDGKELKGKVDKTLFGNYELEFPISYFLPENSKNYNRVWAAMKALNEKKFEYTEEGDNQKAIFRIIEMPVMEKRQKMKFLLNPKIVECFLNFTKGFRKFELDTILSFSSVYAMRFYELFSGQTSPITYKVSYIKERFCITDKYKFIAAFTKRVLDPAKKELDEKAPFSFNYQLNKIGRKFETITFYPYRIAKNRDTDLEKKTLVNQINVSGLIGRKARTKLQDFGFSDKEIKNNIELFENCIRKMPDFTQELSLIGSKARDKKSPKGYIINALKGKLKDLKDC